MGDNTMATVLFVSVFVFLFFKFCLGVPPLGPPGPGLPRLLGADEGEGGISNLAASAADSDVSLPLPLVRKCPVGTEYSVAIGDCKDLVRSTKE